MMSIQNLKLKLRANYSKMDLKPWKILTKLKSKQTKNGSKSNVCSEKRNFGKQRRIEKWS